MQIYDICLDNQGSKGVNWGTVVDVFTHSVYTIMVLNWSSSKPIVWLGLIEVCIGSEDEVLNRTHVNIQQPGVSGESQNTKGLSPVLRLLLADDLRSGIRCNYAGSKDHVVQCTRLRLSPSKRWWVTGSHEALSWANRVQSLIASDGFSNTKCPALYSPSIPIPHQ